jgi:hypothetical protein
MWKSLSEAAPILGVSRQTLWRRLDRARWNDGRRPGAPIMGVHWRHDGRQYFVDTDKWGAECQPSIGAQP